MVIQSNQAGVRSFDFSRLPKVTRGEAGLVNGLYRFLPASLSGETLHRSIESLITGEMGTGFSFGLARVHSAEAAPYLQALPEPGLYAILGMPPLEVKAFCEVDFLIGHAIIDRLLGGEGRPPSSIGPLTEIEQGVFSYLWLKLLAQFFELAGGAERVHFRLQELCSTPEELARFLHAGDRLVVLSFEAKLGAQGGYFKLLFPESFAEKVFFDEPHRPAAGDERRIEALGFVPTHLWAEAGRASVGHREWTALNAGDVILLDKGEIQMKPEGMEGHLTLRVGNGEQGSFRGKLVPAEPGRLRVEIEGAYWEHPV